MGCAGNSAAVAIDVQHALSIRTAARRHAAKRYRLMDAPRYFSNVYSRRVEPFPCGVRGDQMQCLRQQCLAGLDMLPCRCTRGMRQRCDVERYAIAFSTVQLTHDGVELVHREELLNGELADWYKQ